MFSQVINYFISPMWGGETIKSQTGNFPEKKKIQPLLLKFQLHFCLKTKKARVKNKTIYCTQKLITISKNRA